MILGAHGHRHLSHPSVTEIDNELATLDGELFDEGEVAAGLAEFDAMPA